MRFVGVYDYTVILTCLSLFSAFGGILLSSQGMYSWAILCLMFSGICDAFDGTVARTKKNRTQEEKSFGIQLDSLVDVVSFGIFPAFFCWCVGVRGVVGIFLLLFYCTAGVIRLAFFNVLEEKRQQTETGSSKFYRGLPITSVSMILPVLWPMHNVLSENVFVLILQAMLAVVGFFFILDVPVKKLDFSKLLRK